VGIAFAAPDGRFVDVNPALCAFLGRTDAELLATTWQAVTHPDDLRTDIAPVGQLVAGATDHYRRRKRYLRGDGGIAWGDLTLTALRGPEPGQLIQIVDITEQVAAEQALAESEEHARLILETVPDIVFRSSPDLVVEWVSPSVELVLGWTPAWLVGRSIAEIAHPEDVAEVGRRSDESNAGARVSFSARIRHADGTWRRLWTLATPVRGPDGSVVGRIGVARDVDAEHAARTELETRRRELAEAQRLAGMGSWTMDEDGRVTWSENLLAILGLDAGDAQAGFAAFTPLLPPETLAALRSAIAGDHAPGVGWRTEVEIRRPDGARRQVLLVVERGTGARGLQGTVTDVTDERRRLATRARRLARRADYLARVEHTLRTNLSVVEGWASLLADPVPDRDPAVVRSGIEAIARNANALGTHIRGLLTEAAQAARAETLIPTAVDVAGVAASVVADYADLGRVRAITAVPPAGVTALGTTEALDTVVRHLVENAIAHAGPDGSVEVVATPTGERGVVEIVVRDDGPGLPQGTDIFGPFVSTTGSGHGLGLHVVRTLVEGMDGSVDARDRTPGPGAELVVTLRAPA